MRHARRLLVLVVFAAALYVCLRFPAENAETVTISYLFGAFESVPVWVALLGSFVVGAALVLLATYYRVARLRLAARRYRKTVNSLEAEVHQLRNLPLSSEGAADGAASEDLETSLGLERGT